MSGNGAWRSESPANPTNPVVSRITNQQEEQLMNYFKTSNLHSSGIAEGLNLKINLSMKRSYGCRSFELLKTAFLHQLGKWPEPCQSQSSPTDSTEGPLFGSQSRSQK
jgi:hypothetical protein